MTELVWLFGVLMAVAAGLWVVLDMRSTQQSATASSALQRRKFNAQAGRQQLRLLEQQLSDGEIEQADYELARLQLESALLKDLEQAEARPWQEQSWGLVQQFAIPFFIAGLSLGGFWLSAGQQHFERPPEQTQNQQQSLESMVATLASKLQREPDNLEGWIMLGRSYSMMQRYQQAADAFAQANRLTGQQEPDILVAQAESLGLAQGQNLEGEPLRLVEQALALNPSHVRGLWYALIAASAANRSQAQAEYLNRLLAIRDLPPQLAQILEQDFGATLPASDVAENDADLSLQVAVELSAEADAALPSSGTLFVFAKARQGPPMPLAVVKQALPVAWPLRVELNDSMAMTQGMRLSDFDAWTIVARISQVGQAAAQSGDWEGRLQVTSPVEQEIRLTIDRQIP